MKKNAAVNTFEKGMVMDLNPLTVPSNMLTNCLNGTIITYNGNENVLLNDMGNGRVETAYLPEGYVPLGTAELGGIIYIVSYNPLIDLCQIGSFPSPERNITTDDLGQNPQILKISDFFSSKELIKLPFKKLILLDKILHPGDKFQIYCTDLLNKDYISAVDGNNADSLPRYLKFNVVAIQDNGLINNLNNTLIWDPISKYYMLNNLILMLNGKLDLDEYRSLVSSNYNIFNSKVDGKLGILAELECIDSFDVSWDAFKEEDEWKLYLYLNWSYENSYDNNKINLYSVKVDINNTEYYKEILDKYPKIVNGSFLLGDTDILTNTNSVFLNPDYTEEVENPYDNNSLTPRKNDGYDNLYILYNKPITLPNSGTYNFTIYPGMPFGYLDYLKQTFTINVDKLGSGAIDLVEYRYLYNSKGTILNWGLEAYPERNKRIESVTFNFYPFTESIYNTIKNYSGDLDNSKLESPLTISDDNKIEYIVSGKSSYSGNFDDTILGLEENSLYFVEIAINYNNEKTYYYYRFMYTSDIFDKYYFNTNDYKNIVLGDALNILGYLTNQNIIELEDNTVIKEGETEISKLPVSLNESSTKEYTINRNIKYNISANLECLAITNGTTKNDTFEIVVDMSDNPVITVESSNDSKQLLLNNSGYESSSNEKLDEVSAGEGIINNILNTISWDYTKEVITPIKIAYLKELTTPVSYKLAHLDMAHAYLLLDGSKKDMWFYTGLSYTHKFPDGQSDYWRGDREKARPEGALDIYPVTYKKIEEWLKDYDIVTLRCRSVEDANDTRIGNWTTITADKNSNSYDNRPTVEGYWENYITLAAYHTKDKIDNGANIILYAIKNSNGGINVYCYTANKGATWYNVATLNSNKGKWDYNRPITISLSNAKNADILEKPFSKYYKIVNNSGFATGYVWNRIHYYNNYKWSDKFEIASKCDLSLKIKDIAIENSESLPKNLQYNLDSDIKSYLTIENKEDFDNYIDMITIQSSGTGHLVADPNGLPINIADFSEGFIYDENGTRFEYMLTDNGDGTPGTSNFKLKFGTSNDVCVNPLSVTKTYILRLIKEEEWVSVSGVIPINNT